LRCKLERLADFMTSLVPIAPRSVLFAVDEQTFGSKLPVLVIVMPMAGLDPMLIRAL